MIFESWALTLVHVFFVSFTLSIQVPLPSFLEFLLQCLIGNTSRSDELCLWLCSIAQLVFPGRAPQGRNHKYLVYGGLIGINQILKDLF